MKSRDGKSQREEKSRRENRRREKIREEKRVRRKKMHEDAGARKGRKVAKQCVFPMICGSWWLKSRLAKAAGAEPLARWEIKNCTPLWREARFQVKMYKAPHAQTTFGSCDVEKSARRWTVVARSTFRSQNVKTPGVRTTFGGSNVVSPGRRKGLCTLSQVSKTRGFCSIFQIQPPLHHTTLQYTALQLQLHLHYIPLHYTTHRCQTPPSPDPPLK